FTYGYSQSDYRTRNEASGFPFKLDGDSRSHQFRAERVLHRDGVSKTAMSLGLSHQRTNNYVEDTRKLRRAQEREQTQELNELAHRLAGMASLIHAHAVERACH
ncbi:ShlB/FhaC/HecB family hemolysin secretion/activation protein, partial [Pseudomonas aeruginosa]|uniref:ShlB/FhaC/HecB family hemolysin secretion/activation protein n=1 Tax=Pseudomonas aeruginosa TaxID=287 RepID=UPI002238CF5A